MSLHTLYDENGNQVTLDTGMPADINPVEYILRTIEAEVHADGWNERAHLWHVGGLDGGSRMAKITHLATHIEEVGDILSPNPIAFLEQLADLADSVEAGDNERERDDFHRYTRTTLPPDYDMSVMVWESWSVDTRGRSPEEIAEIRANGLEVHPDRVTNRIAMMLAPSGKGVALVRVKDADTPIMMFGIDQNTALDTYLPLLRFVRTMYRYRHVELDDLIAEMNAHPDRESDHRRVEEEQRKRAEEAEKERPKEDGK